MPRTRWVRQVCSVERCIRPECMEMVPKHTPGEHHWSRRKPDLVVRGEEHGMAVLDEQKVREMRLRHARGETIRALAGAYGLNRETVRLAVRRITWRHVE